MDKIKLDDVVLRTQVKRAIHSLYKSVMIDIDDDELNIVRRGFEINYKNERKIQVMLEVREV